jgi:2-polyprenyl-3-methyl-5-hydroxy-6-metoxy-1,4-benzoquinol methylase
MDEYQPQKYWESRLTRKFDLTGVGHIGFSPSYNAWLYRAKERALSRLLKRHNLSLAGARVCDLGCGTGYLVDLYHRWKADQVTGVDITQVSVDRLSKRYPEGRFFQADISDKSLCEKIGQTFAFVSIFDVLYHITDDEKFAQAVRNIAALTQPGGIVVLTDLAHSTVQPADHVKFRAIDQYEAVMRGRGMIVRDVAPLYHLLNREPGVRQDRLRTMAYRYFNLLAPLLFWLDGFNRSVEKSSMSLVLLQKAQG